jgi:hypothetical protein
MRERKGPKDVEFPFVSRIQTWTKVEMSFVFSISFHCHPIVSVSASASIQYTVYRYSMNNNHLTPTQLPAQPTDQESVYVDSSLTPDIQTLTPSTHLGSSLLNSTSTTSSPLPLGPIILLVPPPRVINSPVILIKRHPVRSFRYKASRTLCLDRVILSSFHWVFSLTRPLHLYRVILGTNKNKNEIQIVLTLTSITFSPVPLPPPLPLPLLHPIRETSA